METFDIETFITAWSIAYVLCLPVYFTLDYISRYNVAELQYLVNDDMDNFKPPKLFTIKSVIKAIFYPLAIIKCLFKMIINLFKLPIEYNKFKKDLHNAKTIPEMIEATDRMLKVIDE